MTTIRPVVTGDTFPQRDESAKSGLSDALRRADADPLPEPAKKATAAHAVDEVTKRAHSRLSEPEQARYTRHKSLLRATAMKIFTETMVPERWTNVDDAMLDSMTAWLHGLQQRAGTAARPHEDTIKSEAPASDITVPVIDDGAADE